MVNILRNKIQYVKPIEKKMVFYTIVLVVQIVSFYFFISDMGFGTHDEIYQYITYTNPEWKFSVNLLSRFVPILGQLFLFLQFNSTTIAIYRLYTLFGILLGVGAASLFVKHHISEKDWIKYAIAFLAFLQISGLHNGAVGFDVTYQYRMFYCFMFLDLYLLYCKTEKKRYYIWSSVFWFIAINSYEAFYPFCFILLALAIVFLKGKKKLNFKYLIQYLWLPAVIAVISLVYYVIRIDASGYAYEGVQVSASYGILGKIYSVLYFTMGNFPLRLNRYSLKQIWNMVANNDIGMLFILIKNICVAFILCKGIIAEKITSEKKWYYMIGMSGAGAILVASLASITQQYCDWAIQMKVQVAGISYYAYFFIILCIVIALSKMQKIKKTYLAILAKIVVFALILCIGTITDINNQDAAKKVDKLDNKYELFDDMIHSEYFCAMEDGSVIYAPEFIGVYYNMESLGTYCEQEIGEKHIFVNQLEDIDFNKNVYMLRYLAGSEIMILGKVTDNAFITDEIYVVAKQKLSRSSIYVWRTIEDEKADILVNGKGIGKYGDNIVIPLKEIINKKEMLFQANNLPMQKISFIVGNLEDNAIIQLLGGEGVYDEETFGRWTAKNSQYILEYAGQGAVEAELRLKISTAIKETGKISVTVNDKKYEYEVGEKAKTIKVPIMLEHGENYIYVQSYVESLNSPDKRDINLKLTEAYVLSENNEYTIK